MRKNKGEKKDIEKLNRKIAKLENQQSLDVTDQFGTEIAEIDILTRFR